MSPEIEASVDEIQAITAVPEILETLATVTGMGFVCIAHVTDVSWTTCASLDKLNFGLKQGDQLDIKTTLCDEVRASGKAIIIDSVRDSELYRDHHTPRKYGLQSYFAIPLFRPSGEYFGTLCGIDPKPAKLSDKVTSSTMHLFAQLVSKQLAAESRFMASQRALRDERVTANLREQFIAVLGHDLRTPLSTISTGLEMLARRGEHAGSMALLQTMRNSMKRMASLVDDVLDFARGRMGGGIALAMRDEVDLEQSFREVLDELRTLHPERDIAANIGSIKAFRCDRVRLAQVLSNLLKNALVHGERAQPVQLDIALDNDALYIRVANQGENLPDTVLNQLFEPYWRAAKKNGGEGLGLGLYIVSEIVRSHGGTIDASSEAGTIAFVCRLPFTHG